MTFLPYARQSVSAEDIARVTEVLSGDRLTQGRCIGAFERAVATYCGASHAVAVSNGTAALHVAAGALGLGPGRRLWTSPNSFVASANCALYWGAAVDFVDIDFATGNMNVDALARKLTDADRAGALPDIVVPVHYAGASCDMNRIAALKARYGFRVMEDAAHALGGRYDGHPVGCGAGSDLTIFSFHAIKSITTGEGGMIVTNDDDLAARVRLLANHGIERPDGSEPWSYDQTALGFNYRLTDIQAALGLSQIERLDRFVARRAALAERYRAAIRRHRLPLSPLADSADAKSAWHLFVVHLDADAPRTRRQLHDMLHRAGIGTQVHYIPIHTQPYYAALGFRPGQFPEAERHYARALSLPLYVELSDGDQDRVIDTLCRILNAQD